jgi:hypothetical protein
LTKQSKIYFVQVKWRATNVTLKVPKIKTGIGKWSTTQADIDAGHPDLKKLIMRDNANIKHLIEVLDLEILHEQGMTNYHIEDEKSTDSMTKNEKSQPIALQNGFSLHGYQSELHEKGVQILNEYGIVIYALEMRLGKSHIALETATSVGSKNVLFLTPKKAIKSVEEDMATGNHKFNLTVTNYEQLHKIEDTNTYDLVICDEFHKIGSKFPTPSIKSKLLKKLCVDNMPIIFLSGTPTPESYSQIYNSLAISPFSPFKEYKSFYRWADDYVSVYTRKINGNNIKFYDRADATKIFAEIEHLYLSYTQKEAEFNHEVEDQIHYVKMKQSTYNLYDYLERNQVYEVKGGGAILGDTPAKLMSKLHQISSGSFIKEMDDTSTESVFIDNSKIEYVKQNFRTSKKLAIFYCFDAEGKELRSNFSPHTSDPEEFREWNEGYFISQVRSVREGVKIDTADTLVFYNLGFSSTDYIQARQRHQDRNRDTKPVAHFLFAKGGIEDKVYKAVKNKKNFTARYYK